MSTSNSDFPSGISPLHQFVRAAPILMIKRVVSVGRFLQLGHDQALAGKAPRMRARTQNSGRTSPAATNRWLLQDHFIELKPGARRLCD